MPEVNLDRVGALLRGLLELLWNKSEGLPAHDILAYLPEMTRLTDYEKAYSPSTNTPRYERMIRLATIPLEKAGWLLKSDKGNWCLTEEGRQACRRYPNIQEFFSEALNILDEVRKNTSQYRATTEEAQEKAWKQIQTFLQKLHRTEFQSLVADLLEAMGYHILWIAPPEKSDVQIDIVINKQPIGTQESRVLVQVKHKGQTIPMEGLKNIQSILRPNDFGLLVSSGGFTREVKAEIENEAFQKLTTWDLEKFFDLWMKYYDHLSPEARKRLPLKAIQFIDPEGDF
jgi:restriction system protein